MQATIINCANREQRTIAGTVEQIAHQLAKARLCEQKRLGGGRIGYSSAIGEVEWLKTLNSDLDFAECYLIFALPSVNGWQPIAVRIAEDEVDNG